MFSSKSYKLTFLIDEATIAFKKFPLPILYSLATAIMLLFSEGEFYKVMALMMGIPLSTALTIYSSTVSNKFSKWLPHLTHFIILAMYFYMNQFEEESLYFLQMFIFAFVAHLLVAFSLNLHDKSMLGFWKFNESLFERFLISFIFSNTMFLGLFIFLAIYTFLFGIEFPKIVYQNLWYCCVFIFNTWFFVAGVPLKNDLQMENINFPKKLKMFIEYLLIPLLTLYFILLYIYLFKILATQELPKGKIGLLVSFASLFGIFTLLLGHPLTESSEKNWLKTFSKMFYIAVIPLVLLTLVGLFYRLNQYGITEGRYLLLMICFWLMATSLYFIFSRRKNIKLIPISLSIVSLIISFGPWSVWNVSYNSQMNRFRQQLHKHELYKDGRILSKEQVTKISSADYENLSQLSSYLISHGHKEELNSLLQNPPKTKIQSSTEFMVHLKLYKIEQQENLAAFYFNKYSVSKVVKGYDYYFPIYEIGNQETIALFEEFNLLYEKDVIYVVSKKQKTKVEIVNLKKSFNDLLMKYPDQGSVEEKDFTFATENDLFKIKLDFINLRKEQTPNNNNYAGEMSVLFSKK